MSNKEGVIAVAGDGLRRSSRFRALVTVSLTAWIIVSWAVAGQIAVHRSAPSDFTHFYTIGSLALQRDSRTLYNESALMARQVALVPSSSHSVYLPLYPPQTAVLFAPFAALPYSTAAIAWAAFSAPAYLLLVWIVWRRVKMPAADVAMLATLGFPGFWHLITFGQNTVIVVAAFVAGWMLLERDRRFLAGIAFGVLGFKPQFALLIGIVMLCRREWRMLAGAVLAGALQVALASAVFGVHALGDYVAYFPQIVAHANVVEPHIERTVSLRSVTRMLPPFIGLPLWAIGVASVVWATVALWHESIPVRLRLSVVVIGSILMSPHAYIYDLAVLALPLLWLAPALNRRVHLAVICALFVSLAATMPVSLVNESIGKASMVVTVCLLAGLFAFAGEFARRAVDIRYSERYGPAYVPLLAPLPPFWRGSVVKVTDVE